MFEGNVRKSVVAILFGVCLIGGCSCGHKDAQPTQQVSQQASQQVNNEVVLTEDTYKYSNGFTGKYYRLPEGLVIEDNKTYNVKGIGELKGNLLRKLCRTERFTDANGQPVAVWELKDLPKIESGKDYYIKVPCYIDGKLGGDPCLNYGDDCVVFDCDEETLTNCDVVKVHCEYIVKNFAMNNLVCRMNVLEVISEAE